MARIQKKHAVQLERNYLYLFALFLRLLLALMAASIVFDFCGGFHSMLIAMPCCIFFWLLSQIRSGVARDNSMVAAHCRGSWMYRLRIMLYCFALMAMIGFAVFVWAADVM